MLDGKETEVEATAEPVLSTLAPWTKVGDEVEFTVKLAPLLAIPPTVTTTFPVVAPLGTGATILVALQLVGVAAVPLNVTLLAPCDDPKFVPMIVTEVPTGPEVGLRVEIVGPEPGALTVNVTPALGLRLPLTPVIVITLVPTGVVWGVETVSVEDPGTFIDVGLRLAEAPLGRPLTLNATEPVNPVYEDDETVKLVPVPAATACVPGVTEITKLLVPLLLDGW